MPWTRKEDVDGPFWDADVKVGSTNFNLMVSKEDNKWGFTVADGGGATVETKEGFRTRQLAMRAAASALASALFDASQEAEVLSMWKSLK